MIALVDSGCAEEGYEFIYLGASEECSSCSLKVPCHHNLEEGRKYVVIDLKEKKHPCPLFGEVSVCEVVEPLIDVALDSKKAFKDSSFSFNKRLCDEVLCTYVSYCMPEGLKKGDRCMIETIKNRIKCPKNSWEFVITGVRRI